MKKITKVNKLLSLALAFVLVLGVFAPISAQSQVVHAAEEAPAEIDVTVHKLSFEDPDAI